jgi:uncharacterized damage-inducible protein DinB
MTDIAFDPVRHVAGRLRRTFDGPMWHGASLREVLQEVDAELAHRRDVAGAHSIWALVRHMTVWAEIALARLDGERLAYPPAEEDWPAVSDAVLPGLWLRDVVSLGDAYGALAARVAQLEPADLLAVVPEQDYSVATMLDGVIEHGVWHGGQIAMLKRAAARRG